MANHPLDKTSSAELNSVGVPIAEETNTAWAKLQQKLIEQEPSPVWEAWSKDGVTAKDTDFVYESAATEYGEVQQPNLGIVDGMKQPEAMKSPSAYRRWMKKNGMKTGIAAAAVLICAVIAVPSTNHALAAILGKFKMNQVTVVQENDLQSALDGFFGTDASMESSNKYGKFERSFIGEGYPELTTAQALEQYGIQLPDKLDTSLGEQTELQINGTPGQAITFRLNVDAINGVLSKLGSDNLLPTSVDGKPITLRINEGLSADYQIVDSDHVVHSIAVSYTPTPVLDMDPSINAEEAYEALIRFPVLPSSLKSVLMQSTRISEGELPFPIISNGKVTKSVLEGTDVYFENNSWGSMAATWMDKGIVKKVTLFDVTSRDVAEQIVKELING